MRVRVILREVTVSTNRSDDPRSSHLDSEQPCNLNSMIKASSRSISRVLYHYWRGWKAGILQEVKECLHGTRNESDFERMNESSHKWQLTSRCQIGL